MDGTAAIYLGAPLPTRSCGATRGTGRTPFTPPISPCFGWGLPGFRHRCRNGELLPRLFTLADADASARRYVSVALSVGSPRPAVSGHPVRRSSDFPPRKHFGATARPPRSLKCNLCWLDSPCPVCASAAPSFPRKRESRDQQRHPRESGDKPATRNQARIASDKSLPP